MSNMGESCLARGRLFHGSASGALVILGAAMAFAPAEADAQQTLRFATVATPGGIDYDYMEKLSEMVTERTDGRVEFQLFPASQLGTINEMIQGVKSGTIDMTFHDWASLAPFVDDISVFNVPYLYDDGAHAVRATDPELSPVMAEMRDEMIEKGDIRILGGFYRGARQLTANFPVHSPADLEGKNIRGVPLPIWTSMLKGMGAIPTPVEWAEVPTALATGLVEGQENPLQGIYASKLYEVQPYIMITDHMQSVLGTFINEETWQSLSEEDRKIFSEVVDELAQWSLERTNAAEAELEDKMRAEGVTIIEEEDGLDIPAFRKGVLAQINEDFPEWTQYIERVQQVE